MIRYFLGRDLADRLQIPPARWKRWAREFLPPDPLGGLQSGYARHYSIDEAFTVYLAGQLVSGSKCSIPEARAILADLQHWLAAEGYRTGAAAADGEKSGKQSIPSEHFIIISYRPTGKGRRAGFDYTVRGILERRQDIHKGEQIEQERFVTVRLGSKEDRRPHHQALAHRTICMTRILRHFVGCLDLNPHLFAALVDDSAER